MALSMSSNSYALQVPSRSSRQSTKITVLQAGVMNRGLERKREGATPQGKFYSCKPPATATGSNGRVSSPTCLPRNPNLQQRLLLNHSVC